MKKQKWLMYILVFVLTLGVFQLPSYAAKSSKSQKNETKHDCPSIYFKDFDPNAWYHSDVDYVVLEGLMQGVGDSLFGTDLPTTRGMIITILYRMSGVSVKEDIVRQCKFEDVPKDSWYAKAIAWGYTEKIVSGVSSTEFFPDEPITREQMVTMLYRYAKYQGLDVSQSIEIDKFPDASQVEQWALQGMKWASAIGIINGNSYNGVTYLQPQEKTVRSQAAAFIHRFCEYHVPASIYIEECMIKQNEGKNVLSVKLKGRYEESMEGRYFLIQVDHTTHEMESSFMPVALSLENVRSGEVQLICTRPELKNIVMDKVAIAVLDKNGTYQVVCTPIGISNVEDAAVNKAALLKTISKKGLQGAGYSTAADTNSKHTLFNLDLAEVVGNYAAEGYSEYVYKGETYYFSDCRNLVGEFKALDDGYAQYIQGETGNRTQVAVSLCLMLGYDESNSYLIDPAVRTPGHRYYTMNMREKKAKDTFEALFLYLGELFGQEDCYVTNWILGNEINSSMAYNYSGNLDFSTYINCYAECFRLLYNGVKTQKTGNHIYISLDNGWTAVTDTYAGKATLDKFAESIHQLDKNVDWNVAYHGYSYPLTRNDFWNDNSNTTSNFSTRYISMQNISVLTQYVESLEEQYDKEAKSIRVILSEQGYNAEGIYDTMAESQAQALARGYYMAEFNDRIDAFIIRAVIDDEEEMKGNLFFGLKNLFDEKRITFYTYEYMDSSLEKFGNTAAGQIAKPQNQDKVRYAQNILCKTSWEDIIYGFSRSKLAGMY